MFQPIQFTSATAETNVGHTPQIGGDALAKKTSLTNGKLGALKIVSKDELQEEREYSDEDLSNFQRLYEDTLTEFVEGQLVTGKISAINEKEVAVDIGFKSEGVIPLDEFLDPKAIKIGDDIEVFLDNVEDKEGQLVLSKKKADFMRVWERVLNAHATGEIIQGRCTRRIKGGIVVDLMGIDAFLPGSQIDVKPIRDFDQFIGKIMDFKVVKVNELRKNIVVSHRVLVEEQMSEQRQRILANLAKGQVLDGSVKNITDFGVFIDLGGVDGLLHINDLSWGRVNHPSETVQLDQKLKVMVLDFNEAKDRISLGLKQLQPHPWIEVDKKYPVGAVVRGKVVSISDYGAFVELERGVEGLIHISEMSWTQHIRHPSKILSVGEMVEAKVLSIDLEERKISLGLKQLEPDPWEGIELKYPVGSRQKGIVRNLTNFGAFVELEEGIDGLIHISDLSWTKKIRHPGEVVKKGDEIEVIVLNVDKGNRRISLGYKQTKDNPWDEFEGAYGVHTKTKGKILRMIDKGVIVELPALVDGFVPLSHLAKTNLAKPADGYAVGDELELVVIEFNKDNKKIILSEKLTKEPHGEGGKRKRGRGKPAEAGAPEVKLTPEELAAAEEVLSDTASPVMEVAAETPAPEFTVAEPEPQA
jgi:small subunit ribosomal protein S1